MNRPNTSETQGRAFPTGFNDFRKLDCNIQALSHNKVIFIQDREDDPEEIPDIVLELNKTQLTPSKPLNKTLFPLETPESTKQVTSTASILTISTSEEDPLKSSDSDSPKIDPVIVSDTTSEPEHHLSSANFFPSSTEFTSRPPYIKVRSIQVSSNSLNFVL